MRQCKDCNSYRPVSSEEGYCIRPEDWDLKIEELDESWIVKGDDPECVSGRFEERKGEKKGRYERGLWGKMYINYLSYMEQNATKRFSRIKKSDHISKMRRGIEGIIRLWMDGQLVLKEEDKESLEQIKARVRRIRQKHCEHDWYEITEKDGTYDTEFLCKKCHKIEKVKEGRKTGEMPSSQEGDKEE